MNTKCRIFLILIIGLIPTTFWAQGFGAWETLYKDNVISVEVSFKIENSSCTNYKKHKIQYRVNGKLSSFDDYLIWTTDYIDCNGKTIFQEHCLNISINNPASNGSSDAVGDTWASPDDEFLADKIVTQFYDVRTSNYPSKKNGIKVNLNSVMADGIAGNSIVTIGESNKLSVKGGVLGAGANWVWYSGFCGGTPIGTGNSINVSPVNKTTYFVRAESPTKNTNCVEMTVQVKSKTATRIMGNTEVHEGEEANLSVEGGKLTIDAMWVWYALNLDNSSTKIGTGSSIKVKPKGNPTIFVRAESPNDISDIVKTTINVKSKNPISIICEKSVAFGDTTKLMVEGGYAAPGEEWVWYEGKIGGEKIGSGKLIFVTPLETATYFVRIEGKNYNSTSVSATLQVTPKTPVITKGLPYFNKVDFTRNGSFNFNYQILGAQKGDNFDIIIKTVGKNKIALNQKTIKIAQNDLNNGTGIYKWDSLNIDYLNKNKIYFELEATNNVKIPTFNHLLKSVAFPGWGDYKLRNKKYYLIYGILSYSLLYTSYHFNQVADKSYYDYKASFDSNESNKLYNKAISSRNLSYASFAAAAFVWTVDVSAIIVKAKKLKKNKASSKYYYERDNYKFTGQSMLK